MRRSILFFEEIDKDLFLEFVDTCTIFQRRNYYNIKCKCYENRFISVIIKAYEWTFMHDHHAFVNDIIYDYIPYHFAYHQIVLFIVYCCKKKKRKKASTVIKN